MRKELLIIALVLALVIAMPVGLADSQSLESDSTYGAYPIKESASHFLHNLFKTQYVVNDAYCSTSPDIVKVITASDNTFCFTSNTYEGTSWNMWELKSDGSYGRFIGKFDVDKGDKKCTSVTKGQRYVYEGYFCDDVSNPCKSCSNYVSAGCGAEGCSETQMARIRDCPSGCSEPEKVCVTYEECKPDAEPEDLPEAECVGLNQKCSWLFGDKCCAGYDCESGICKPVTEPEPECNALGNNCQGLIFNRGGCCEGLTCRDNVCIEQIGGETGRIVMGYLPWIGGIVILFVLLYMFRTPISKLINKVRK